jgi:hypothetical protein
MPQRKHLGWNWQRPDPFTAFLHLFSTHGEAKAVQFCSEMAEMSPVRGAATALTAVSAENLCVCLVRRDDIAVSLRRYQAKLTTMDQIAVSAGAMPL